MNFSPRLFVCVVLAFGSWMPARASVIININQSGNNVVAVANGSLNLAGLSFIANGSIQSIINAFNGSLYLGGTAVISNADVYTGASNITSFGSALGVIPNSVSGSPIGLSSGSIRVPTGYVSGTQISSTAQWNNRTLVSMGLTPGQYVSTWSNDSVTVNIVDAVPEPSSMALVALGSLALLFRCFRSRS